MKLNKFFMGIFGALALTACSSEDPVVNEPTTPEEFSDGYVSVSIMMPTAAGTRAEGAGDNDSDKFDDGTAEESAVNNIVFFFFDAVGNCVDIQKINNPKIETEGNGTENDNPYVTKYGTVEVRLKAGLTYKQVAVALNTSVETAGDLKDEITTIADLYERGMDYTEHISDAGMVMSNSVFFDTAKYDVTPTEATKVCIVPIDEEKNVYTSAQRPKIQALIASGEKEYVEIYVERVVARIDVTEASFDMTDYYTYEENSEKKKTITLYDHVNNSSSDITVQPVIKGMCLNVLTPETRLIKPININQVGYGKPESTTGSFKNFKWNDPDNKRSYWASTTFLTEDEMLYYSWNDAVKQGGAKFSQYINPNTQDWSPAFGTDGIRTNEGGSLNTKVMVVAELHKVENGEVGDALSLVRYGADYMLPTSLLEHAANIINIAVRSINWSAAGLTINDAPLTEQQLSEVVSAVSYAYEVGLTGSQFELNMLNNSDPEAPGDADWEATIAQTSSFALPTVQLAASVSSVATQVNEKISNVVTSTLNTLNDITILYWKEGKTYYFTNIRHQGFYGLTGNSTASDATDFLYGVVRNHIYKVSLDGVFGLGTPVIDPGKPIDPDRPKNERPSYIQAKINILPWRVVTNSSIIH